MDIRETTFRKAALMLSAIGAQYAIVYDGKMHTSNDCKFAMLDKDGTLHGSIESVQASKRRKSGGKPRNDWSETGYVEALDLLAAGESWEYTARDREQAIALQKTVSGRAGQLWGSGNYLTTCKGNVVEILRLK